MRQYYKCLLIGSNQTGKTYFTRHQWAKSILAGDKEKTIIIVTDNLQDNSLKGIPKCTSIKNLPKYGSGIVAFWDSELVEQGGNKMVFAGLHKLMKDGKLNKGGLVFDDATKWFTEGKLDRKVEALLYDYRHSALDILIIMHSISSVPKRLLNQVHIISLKKTLEPGYDIKYFQKRGIPNYTKVYQAYKTLQEIDLTKTPEKWKTITIMTGLG